MRKQHFFLLSIFLFAYSSISPQDITVNELVNKVLELEKRVESLEKIIESKNQKANDNIDTKSASSISNWRKLRIGMTESEVRNILGEPLQIKVYNSSMYFWYYSKEIWHSKIDFDNNKVTGWQEPDIK